MTDTVQVIYETSGERIRIPMGTSLLELARKVTPGDHPFLAAYVNNRIRELNYRIFSPVSLRFVDITSFAGLRVYQRTSWFLLQLASGELFPGKRLHIRHSMGQSGFYCEIDGIDEFTPDEAAQLRDRMRELSVRNLPITRQRMLTTEVRARYAEEGFTDKIALLDTRPRLYSQLYTLDDTAGYFYGSLAPSTGYVTLFDIEPYYNGFYLSLPLRTAPDRLQREVHQEKMFDIFREYQSWVRIMGVPTVGDVNSKVLAGDAGGMIKLAEAFHERKFAQTADAILEAKRSVTLCPVCQNLTSGGLCPICASPKRDDTTICVVADPRDVVAIERSREYNGRYHVLHGVLSPMNHVGPDDLQIKSLVDRVAKGGIHEVIMATNPDTEGETTAMYLARLLKPFGVKVTRLAYGIPVGGHLEFADDATLMRALEGRREL